MPQSLDPNLQEALDDLLESDCPELKPEARAIWTIMLEDGKTLDMLGVYYSMNLSFEYQEEIYRSERALGSQKFVEIIRRRNPAYDKLTFKICTAMYHLSGHPSYEGRYPNSCRGEKWRAIGAAVNRRGYCWDHTNEDEEEAISIYRQMVKEAGLKPLDYGRSELWALYPDKD